MGWNPWRDKAELEHGNAELVDKLRVKDEEISRLRDEVASRDDRLRSKAAQED